MGLNAVKILEISVTINSKKEILEYIRKYLQKNQQLARKPLIIVTPNPEQIVYAQSDKHFAKILNKADIAIPDGIGVVWASRGIVRERIPGVELVEDIAELASRERVPIGLIGGRDKVAVEALECLQKKYPGLVGWTTEKRAVLPGARIIFVGLGAPKQEYFIDEAAKKTRGVIFMAVGGSFDIIAGRTPRAPLLIRLIGFEWAWRLVKEPWRWERQLSLLKFVWLVGKEKIRIIA